MRNYAIFVLEDNISAPGFGPWWLSFCLPQDTTSTRCDDIDAFCTHGRSPKPRVSVNANHERPAVIHNACCRWDANEIARINLSPFYLNSAIKCTASQRYVVRVLHWKTLDKHMKSTFLWSVFAFLLAGSNVLQCRRGTPSRHSRCKKSVATVLRWAPCRRSI